MLAQYIGKDNNVFRTGNIYNIELKNNAYMDCIELYYENKLEKWYANIRAKEKMVMEILRFGQKLIQKMN